MSKEINIGLLKQLHGGGHLSQIIEDIKTDIIRQMMATRVEDTNKREELYQLNRAMDKVEAQVISYINDEIRKQENVNG